MPIPPPRPGRSSAVNGPFRQRDIFVVPRSNEDLRLRTHPLCGRFAARASSTAGGLSSRITRPMYSLGHCA